MIRNVLIMTGLLYAGAIMEKKFGILEKTVGVAKKAEDWLFTTTNQSDEDPETVEETK